MLAGLLAFFFHPSPDWVQHAYANGFYAKLQHIVTPITNHVPFAVYDAMLIFFILVLPAWFIARIVRAPNGERIRTAAAIGVHCVAIVALLYAWFYVFWGWNYSRPSATALIDYDGRRATPRALHALAARIQTGLNSTVASAHAEHDRGGDALAMNGALQASYEDVMHRLGDRFDPVPTVPKTTFTNPYLAAVGISGFIDPYALETVLNGEQLWFERPFNLGHEWGHLGGFADESEANFIGAVIALHTHDPAMRYSGWVELYAHLPAKTALSLKLSKPVEDDLIAMRDRILKHLYRPAFHFQWKMYDTYLKSNHVAAGVESYNQLIQLVLGTRFDPDGLPSPRRP